MIVCIDAGHGGVDPGAVGLKGLREKDVTLAISIKLKTYLEREVHVVMTRNSDILPWGKKDNLFARAEIANKAEADCFISIHCNASRNRQAEGVEVFHYPGDLKGKKLAEKILDEIVLEFRPKIINRGIKTAYFDVLRYTKMPAVLVETDFISNPVIEQKMLTQEWRDRNAKGIAKGIFRFFRFETKETVKTENWKENIMGWGRENLKIDTSHNADDFAPKWFVIEIARRLQEKK